MVESSTDLLFMLSLSSSSLTTIECKKFWYHRCINSRMKKSKSKSKSEEKSKRLLVSVNVLGSAGAIRFIVKGDDDAAAVIHTALKIYAREGRLPLLGSDVSTFTLYSAHAGFQTLNPSEKIGSRGGRSFVLSKRERQPEAVNRKGGGWRAWLHKSLSLKILMSH